MNDNIINAAIIAFNWIALGDIGTIVGILVGITWIIKNLVDARCKLKQYKDDKNRRNNNPG